MADQSSCILLNSGSSSSGDEDSSEKENPSFHPPLSIVSPSIIPASDDDMSASSRSGSKQYVNCDLLSSECKSKTSIKGKSHKSITPLQSKLPSNSSNSDILQCSMAFDKLNIRPNAHSDLGLKEKKDPTPPVTLNSIFTGTEHDILYVGNITSTPLLSNTRKIKPLDDLDLTAISEDDGINSSSISKFRSNPKLGRQRQRIESSSSSVEDICTANNEDEDSQKGFGDSGLDVLNVSSQVNKMQLADPKDKKNFNFRQKEPTVVDIDGKSLHEFYSSNEEKSVEDTEEVYVSTEESKSGSENSSPEVVFEQQQARRVVPSVPKGVGLPTKEPKIKFIDLPVAGPALPVATCVEYQVGVKSAISKLTEAMQSMPTKDKMAINPSCLKVDLFDHQRYGLEWMCWREQHFPGGGILADEMGLGKTIMVIALVLRSKMGDALTTKPKNSSWISADTRNLVPSRSTLVIVPPAVLAQWEDEIRKKARGMRVCIYHGSKRTTSAPLLVQYDFVLSTYNTIGSEIPKSSEEKSRSPLLRIHWERIVLDEGHVIRNSSTKGAQAVCRLSAFHRWVVTGTPIHNKPADLHSLVKFLRVSPFDDPKVWNFWIGLKNVANSNTERLNIIGKALILRRTKDEVKMSGGNVASIPPKTVLEVKIALTPEERQIYDHLYAFAESQFKMFLKSHQEGQSELQNAANNYVAGVGKPKSGVNAPKFTHIFVLLLRLRQASVLPFLITKMLEDETSDEDLSEAFDPLNHDDVISRKNPVFSERFQSAKLRQLYEDLEDLRDAARDEDRPMEKVVVVSQWTTLLNVVRDHLSLKGFSLTTISGEVKLSDRTDLMFKFNNNPSKPQIMLLSLAAGGVGLNLIGANRLFFLDLHWNPQLELQAQDRVHRFGQTKNVTITRYVSENTMEERVFDLQKRKLELANGLLSNDKPKVGSGLSIQEMRQLFMV